MDRVEHPYVPRWQLLIPQRFVPALAFPIPMLIILYFVYEQIVNPRFEDLTTIFILSLLGVLLFLFGFAVVVTCEAIVLTSNYISTNEELVVFLFNNLRVVIPWETLQVERIVELETYSIANFFSIRQPIYIVYVYAPLTLINRIAAFRFLGVTGVSLPMLFVTSRHGNYQVLIQRIAHVAGIE